MRVTDLTGSGKLDLVTTDTGSSAVSVLIGNGDGSFQPARTYPVGLAPQCLNIGDVNGDHTPDIVTGNAGSNNVSVLLGNGDGTFRPGPASPSRWSRSHPPSEISPVAVCSPSRAARSAPQESRSVAATVTARSGQR
jgi:hypothetical protein